MKIKLISFPICPFVHRCAITLKFKNAPYEIEYIDLQNKPDWFLKISPLGKVPLMIIDNKDIIFESLIINELIDELYGNHTLSKNPIEKAKERAWIEFASAAFTDFAQIINSSESIIPFKQLLKKFTYLENVISDSGFFKSNGFSIIDSAYAPLFYRLKFIDSIWFHEDFMALKKVYVWAKNLAKYPYVKESVRDDFADLFTNYIKSKNSQLLPNICIPS